MAAARLPQTVPADESTQGGPGSLDSMLQDVLGGALGGSTAQVPTPQQTQQSSGGGILDILGGLLGGGRR